MSEQWPFMVPPYAALAAVYDRAGLADYARQSVLRYVTYAQSIDWAGHRVLDLGCGTGVTSWLLAERGFRVVGVDNSLHMLSQAESRAPSAAPDALLSSVSEPPGFVQMDIRELESPLGPVDLILAVGGVLNAIQSLRELEAVLGRVSGALAEGKLFIFDMRTIGGLAAQAATPHIIHFDDGASLMVLVRCTFSYETLTATQHYTILTGPDGTWQRWDELHLERGYPVQGLAAVLERAGFHVRAVLTPALEPFDVQNDRHGRVVFVAQKNA